MAATSLRSAVGSSLKLLVSLSITTVAIPARAVSPDDAGDQGQSLDDLLGTKISAASKYEQTTRQAPASVTIITAEDIRLHGYRTLSEALRNVRGLYVSYDRDYTYAGVRGFSRPTDFNDRILILLNGHSLNENVYASSAVGSDLCIDLRALERIEIVRGPGSALYGANAMFAVINLVTKRAAAIDGGEAFAQVEEDGYLRGSVLAGKETGTGFGAVFSATALRVRGEDLYFPEFDSPETNGGVAHGLDTDRAYGAFGLLTFKDFTLQGVFSSREKGVPTASYETRFDDPREDTLDARGLLELKAEHDFQRKVHFLARGYFDYYRYKGHYPYEELQQDGSVGTWFGSEIQLRWDTSSWSRLTTGVEVQDHLRRDYQNVSPTQVFFDANFPYRGGSIYVEEELQPTRFLTLVVGGRHDDFGGYRAETHPRAALLLTPTISSTFKLLYGDAYRAPNVYEAFFEDPTAGYKANPRLVSEKIRTVELVWEQRIGHHLHGTMSLYDYAMRDLIDQVVDPADGMLVYENQSRVKASGVELELSAQLPGGASLSGSLALQSAKDSATQERLTNSPRCLARLVFATPILGQVWVAGDLGYESQRRTIYDTTTDAFFLANVQISTRPLMDHLRLFAFARNVFDERYSLPGGFEHRQRAIEQDGRKIGFSVAVSF